MAFIGQKQGGEHQELDLGRARHLLAQVADLVVDVGGQLLDPFLLAVATGELIGTIGDLNRNLRHCPLLLFLRPCRASRGVLKTTLSSRAQRGISKGSVGLRPQDDSFAVTSDRRPAASGCIPSPVPADLPPPLPPSSVRRAGARAG